MILEILSAIFNMTFQILNSIFGIAVWNTIPLGYFVLLFGPATVVSTYYAYKIIKKPKLTKYHGL